MIVAILLACAQPSPSDPTVQADSGPDEVPWSGALPALDESVRGFSTKRAIVHLHSPWSHDACDGDPMPDGAPDPACLADLRAALCTTAIDAAFLTDHPAHAAEQDHEALYHAQPGDERVGDALRIGCDDGHRVLWFAGIEDELMPVALDRHVADTPEENDRLYDQGDAEALAAEHEAGGVVLVAHTEGRDPAQLAELQAAGLDGVEIFNLHAMFAPDIREEDLGLDPWSWLLEVEPFTSTETTGEPDLLFLGVLQPQPPSLERWDTLLQTGPMVGVAGTDAHQNVLPLPLRDGERGDSYRRMMRWFGNVLLVDGDGPEAYSAALQAGRAWVAFEVLGTPVGFDVHLRDDGGVVHELGSDAPTGTLVVGCPTLHPSSPRGPEAPEIEVRVLRDGLPWAEGCGEHPVTERGVYRVEVDLLPWHLRPFLGDAPEPWLRSYPWIVSNAIRVAL